MLFGNNTAFATELSVHSADFMGTCGHLLFHGAAVIWHQKG